MYTVCMGKINCLRVELAVDLFEATTTLGNHPFLGEAMQPRRRAPELLHQVAGEHQPEHVQAPVICFHSVSMHRSLHQAPQKWSIHHILQQKNQSTTSAANNIHELILWYKFTATTRASPCNLTTQFKDTLYRAILLHSHYTISQHMFKK